MQKESTKKTPAKSMPRKRRPQPQAEAYPYKRLDILISEEGLDVFGLLPGDILTAEPCPDDPQCGDFLVMYKKGESEEWCCGRFDGFVDCETGRKYSVKWMDGGYYLYRDTEYWAYKATTIHRPVKHGEAAESETERRLKRLRARLEKINADDITNSTAILKLEKEIYDLEHPVDLDDWSAWEEGGES
jgi:hypothetical protein